MADGGAMPVNVAALLAARIGEDQVSTAKAVREHHAKGEGYIGAGLPDVVVFPDSTEHVQAVVQVCAQHRIPIVPFGTGTSLEGQVNAVHGGVTIDLTRMDRVLAVHAEDMDCHVQAGVRREQLNIHLRDQGLFFPIDPGANASLGGMASTRASGTNAVRYGTMREVVLGLTAVMPDGQIIHTGGRARKSASGYDLTRLLVGSEGTLGVITELRLRLFGIPEAITSAVCQFDDLEGAVNLVIAAIQLSIPVARIELLDEIQMAYSIAYSKLAGLEERPTLFFEFHGTGSGAREQAEQIRELADEFGGSAFKWSATTEERNALWKARHDAYWSVVHANPGLSGLATDACVPISRLADAVLATKRDLAEHGIKSGIVGHVGDGNFHCLPMFDPNDQAQLEQVRGFTQRLAERTLAMGGTVSGEHGIGIGKMKYLEAEHGAGVGVMRLIKQALDPAGIMNPGKVLPD